MDNGKEKRKRIAVQQDTIKIFTEKTYVISDKKIELDEKLIQESIINTKKYESNELILTKNPNFKTIIRIVNCDCLEVGLTLLNFGYNTSVLNMASFKNPGGGYLNGAGAQEESIFRRTNMHLCLDRKDYPIKFDQIIYSPKVTVVKRSEALKYALMPPKMINIITCPAVKLTHKKTKLSTQERFAVISKIELIFKLGIFKGDECLVLGAFGCGAYNNPSQEVATIFCQMIEKYYGYFKHIAFAIINDRNGLENVEVFSKTMKLEPLKIEEYEILLTSLKAA